MIVTELAGEHPQAPMMQVSGNEATPFAQQLAVVTVPPVEVQSSDRRSAGKGSAIGKQEKRFVLPLARSRLPLR